MNNVKGFYITVKNGLLDSKHLKAMKGERTGTVWLFLWFLDKMTIINHETGEGKVLGGKPIKYEEVKKDLGISRIIYTRYIKTLRDGGYIKTLRTPYGLVVTVYKAVKIFGKRSITNDTSKDVSESKHHYARSDTSNKTIQLDNTVRQEKTSSYRGVVSEIKWRAELALWRKSGGRTKGDRKYVEKNGKKLLLDRFGKWEEIKK